MYIPLKVTTDYTMLKSLIKIPDLINFLHNKNINVCGICDENLYGSLEFYYACKKALIKPIIGLNIKLENKDIYLYAINLNGYKNLLKVHTLKEKGILDVKGLLTYKDNILCIIPYKSKDLYNDLSFYNNLYISYESSFEKTNALFITDKVLFLSDIRAFDKDEILYLNILDDLRKDERHDYSNNYFKEVDIDFGKLNEVVNLLNLELSFEGNYIPKYKEGIDSSKFLSDLCIKGLKKRLNGYINDGYLNRLKYELDIINKMGFVDYFLIVYDYVLYAKKNNILVGPGRGSAASSLVSYSIGITDVDPIKYDLLFERFLNPERITMPDIDIDFDALKRENVINYVKKRYGNDKVALGLTFNTLKSKLVLRDIGKLLKINDSLLDNFIKNINGNLSLKENLDNINIKKYLTNYKELKNLYSISMHLEGLKKNTSTHAAGVIISSKALDDIIPIHYENNTLITGITMDYLEKIGLLKMDFLALKNLTTIKNIIDEIGIDNLNNINLNDSEVFSLFINGKTDGIFQFETELMKNLSMKIKPNCFDDLIAILALARPGAINEADEYKERKNNLKKVEYIHKNLKPILKSTYGIILYQEQIIAILGKIGGFSLKDADVIRRAISKKKENIIACEKEKFISGAINNGYTKEIANKIYELIVKFSSYGFNKAHSTSYAMISYQMAYLKVKYPKYFITQMLNNKDSDKFFKIITFLKKKGINIEKPNINESLNKFFIKNNKLIMPLKEIIGISSDISDKIVKRRKNGYLDYFDFVCKNKDILNESILKILIKAEALRCFNLNMHTLIENIESALNYADIDDDLIKKPVIVEYNDYTIDEKRTFEYEVYNFFISNHPSSIYQNAVKIDCLNNYLFKNIKSVVLINKITTIKTKKGESMAFINASDETGFCDLTIFPKNYELISNFKNNDLVEISGTVSKRFDKTSIIVNNIKKVV